MNIPTRISRVKAAVVYLTLMLLTMISAGNLMAESVIFSDDFQSSTLNPAWQVLPGLGSYTVGGGNLNYSLQGPTSSTTGWFNPALTFALPFSGTNWEIDTEAKYSLQWCPPGQSYTGPTTPTPGCTSGAQGPQVAVAFNPGAIGNNYAGSDFALIERNIDAFYGSNSVFASYGAVNSANLLNPADSNIVNNIADGTYWYQIERNGGELTVNYSYDGVNYFTAFSTTLANPSGTDNEFLLGAVTFSSAGSQASYDYVHIFDTSTPEPSTWALLGVGLLALPIARRRCSGTFGQRFRA